MDDIGDHHPDVGDVLRLTWDFRKLAHTALRMQSRWAITCGLAGWFVLINALLFAKAITEPNYGTDLFERRLIGNVIVSIGIAVIVVMCVLFLFPLQQDQTSVLDRARAKAILLGPWCLAFVAWSLAAASGFWHNTFLMAFTAAFAIGLLFNTPRQLTRLLKAGRCITCGYSLIGLTEKRCPECGNELFPGQQLPEGEMRS